MRISNYLKFAALCTATALVPQVNAQTADPCVLFKTLNAQSDDYVYNASRPYKEFADWLYRERAAKKACKEAHPSFDVGPDTDANPYENMSIDEIQSGIEMRGLVDQAHSLAAQAEAQRYLHPQGR